VTGNVYCKDPADHFFENCLRNRRLLTVRTHDTWVDNGRYEKAVIIIRSPYTAITAEFKSYLRRNDKRHPPSSKQYKGKLVRGMTRDTHHRQNNTKVKRRRGIVLLLCILQSSEQKFVKVK